MTGADVWRAAIPPGDAAGPRWSVMIPAYNCADCLAETLESVLAQDPGAGQMQIEVVDDASDDRPEEVVQRIGRGRVEYFRQPSNVGHVENFTTCLVRARGDLVHLLHGDDWVLPGFYETMERPFAAHAGVGAAFCRVRTHLKRADGTVWTRDEPPEVPEPGVVPDWLFRIAAGQRVQTPSMVVRRAVYERLGSFDRRLRYAEDWEMWVRIAAAYPVWHEPEVLAVYRMRPQSSTGRLAHDAETIRDLRRASALIEAYIPPERRREIRQRSRRFISAFALETARRSFDADAPMAAARHLVEAWRSEADVATLRGTLPVLRDGIRWLRRAASPGRRVSR